MRITRLYWRGWNPSLWRVFGFVPSDALSRGRYRMFRVGPVGAVLDFGADPEDRSHE